CPGRWRPPAPVPNRPTPQAWNWTLSAARFVPSVVGMTTLVLAPPARARLVSRPLLVRSVSIMGSSVGFYLPLSVVPLLAKQAGSERGAGLATVTLLLATVACELVTPRLVARLGYRPTLALGLILLGSPSLALTVSGDLKL